MVFRVPAQADFLFAYISVHETLQLVAREAKIFFDPLQNIRQVARLYPDEELKRWFLDSEELRLVPNKSWIKSAPNTLWQSQNLFPKRVLVDWYTDAFLGNKFWLCHKVFGALFIHFFYSYLNLY